MSNKTRRTLSDIWFQSYVEKARKVRASIKLLVVLITLVVWSAPTPATTLTGTAKKPDGTTLNGQIFLSLSQQASLNSGCGGPAIILPTTVVKITVTSGTLASTSVFGNDCMNPQGTYYNVRYIDNNANTVFNDRWVITGSSIDVGTIVSAVITGTTATLGSTGVVFFVPPGNQTVTQPGGTVLGVNLFRVTNTFTLPNGGVCTSLGCTNVFTNGVTLDTNQTISGQKTFSSDILFAGAQLGSSGSPATNVWASALVTGQTLRTHLGNPATPTDFFVLKNTAIHQFAIINSTATNVLQFDDGVSPVYTYVGTGKYLGLSGTGNAFACLDSTGKLYRSGTACN